MILEASFFMFHIPNLGKQEKESRIKITTLCTLGYFIPPPSDSYTQVFDGDEGVPIFIHL